MGPESEPGPTRPVHPWEESAGSGRGRPKVKSVGSGTSREGARDRAATHTATVSGHRQVVHSN